MSTLRYVAGAALGTARVTARRLVRGPARPSWSWRTEVVREAVRLSLDGGERWGIQWLRDLQGRQADPEVYSDPQRAAEAGRLRTEAEAELERLYAEWEELASSMPS